MIISKIVFLKEKTPFFPNENRAIWRQEKKMEKAVKSSGLTKPYGGSRNKYSKIFILSYHVTILSLLLLYPIFLVPADFAFIYLENLNFCLFGFKILLLFLFEKSKMIYRYSHRVNNFKIFSNRKKWRFFWNRQFYSWKTNQKYLLILPF